MSNKEDAAEVSFVVMDSFRELPPSYFIQLDRKVGGTTESTMWFRRSGARLNQGRQQVMLVGVSLSLTYFIALLTLMNQWINFWLRGSYYLSYQAIFLTVLLIFFLVRLRRQHKGQPPGISIVLFGGVAGYVAGVIAFLLHPIFQENGLHQVLATLQFPARETVIAFLWFPVRLLSWLFGAITGVVMVLISRRFGTHRSEHLTATFQFAHGDPRNARSQCNQ